MSRYKTKGKAKLKKTCVDLNLIKVINDPSECSCDIASDMLHETN
jgi:hypothetical protein